MRIYILIFLVISSQLMTVRSFGFSPAQRVDVEGAHAFRPPGPYDQRGPCPGLNALANHNYLPHNGVATISQFISATSRVYGLGVGGATLLTLLGTVFTGDAYSFSIGGPASSVGLGNLLARPLGLSYAHNKIEGDASVARGDYYLYRGDAHTLRLDQFADLYTLQNNSFPNYDMDTVNLFHAKRLQQSIDRNPYFFSSPVALLFVTGAYFFLPRLMANHSAEYPEGVLDREVLKSFFAVSGDNRYLRYTEGHERIPYNWYRRPFGDEYELPQFIKDLVAAVLKYPQFVSIGGNTGTVNSFTPVDLGNLTGGVYNAQTLLEGNNAACFVFQAIRFALPDILNGVPYILHYAVNLLHQILRDVTAPLSCPQLFHWDPSQIIKYPGARN